MVYRSFISLSISRLISRYRDEREQPETLSTNELMEHTRSSYYGSLGFVIRQPVALSISRFIVYLSSRSLLRKINTRPAANIGLISVRNYNIREFHNRLDETLVAAHVYLTPAVIFIYIPVDIPRVICV